MKKTIAFVLTAVLLLLCASCSRGGNDNGADTTTAPVVTDAPTETTTPTTAEPTTLPPDAKPVYLTFDDGPGKYTARLLDILDKYGVKATFFVTNMHPEYVDLIEREARSGHCVAVHTYSHDYNKIYASEQAFWSDYNAMNDLIKQRTGKVTNLFRFPGGSSNTVSDFNPGIMTRLTDEADRMGRIWVDWNVDSDDAGSARSASAVCDNLQYAMPNHTKSVVLCHDVKDYTVDAMETFIPWALGEGYVFLALDEDCWPAQHGVLN